MQSNKKIYLRFAEEEDCDVLFRWRNDPVTRKFSFNTKKILYRDHIVWFNNSLEKVNRNIFIVLNEGNEKIGQIRFDRVGNVAEISIIVAPSFRGKGFGTILLRKGCNMYFNNYDIKNVVAKIKSDNVPSIKLFTTIGFKTIKVTDSNIEMKLSKK